MTKESNPQHREPPNLGAVPRDPESRVPIVLSAIAGMVDVIGFLSFQLFTAHITGNLVLIAAQLVSGGLPNISVILSIPVFALAVVIAWLIARELSRRGPRSSKPLLLLQFLLLICVLIISVIFAPAQNPHELMAVVAPMIAISAMATQFTLLRQEFPQSPSTAVMTGNLTNAVLSLMDIISRREPASSEASQRLKKTAIALGGFFGGCITGALAVLLLGNWSWSLPVILAGMAVVVL